jgi:transcriptional regulator of acetoin/glycerol metabolism
MSERDLINTVPHSSVSEVSFREEGKEFVNTSQSLSFKDIEKESIARALAVNEGNVLKAAKDLHISRATIYRKIKKYSINL